MKISRTHFFRFLIVPFAVLTLAALADSSSYSAQKNKTLSDVELAKITARGQMMQEYDVASWHATDAVVALKPPDGSVARYIAQKTNTGWVVVFGRFSEAKDGFLIAYKATQGATPEQFNVEAENPPQKDTGFFFAAAKGIQLALDNSTREKRPYNTYVLPLDSGDFYVYVLPAQTENDVYPLGGDTRFLISTDGSRIIETRQMHKSILEMKPDSSDKTKAADFHSHVLSDVPEDSDVFHVLRQTHPVPAYVMTSQGMYEVATDGTIRIVVHN